MSDGLIQCAMRTEFGNTVHCFDSVILGSGFLLLCAVLPIYSHIEEMRRIYDLLPEKPEWLTMEEIDSYAQRMAPRYQVAVYHSIVNGFDEMPEYQTLQEAEQIARDCVSRKRVDYVYENMEEDGFHYEGAAVLDVQERQWLFVEGYFSVLEGDKELPYLPYKIEDTPAQSQPEQTARPDYDFNNAGHSSAVEPDTLLISDEVQERAEQALAERNNPQNIVDAAKKEITGKELEIQAAQRMNPKSESIIDAQPQMVPNIEEYTRIKAQYPNHVVGVQNGDVIYFYGTEAEKAGPALDRNVLIRDIPGMSAVSITGDAESWQASREKLLRKGIDLAFTRLDDTGKYAELSFLCFLLNHFFLCFCQTNCQSFCSFSGVLHTFLLSKAGPGYCPVFYVRGGQPRALLAPAGGLYGPPLPGNPAI